MKKNILVFFTFLLILNIAFAQNSCAQFSSSTGCGSELFANMWRRDTAHARMEQIQNQQLTQLAQSRRNQLIQKKVTSINESQLIFINHPPVVTHLIDISIPIVFHIVNNNPDAVTDQMINDALVQLNDAFAHRNTYAVDTLGANTHIQFCLAKRAPDGGKTNGIDRIKSYYQDIDMDLEPTKLPVLADWDPSRYANVWLVNSVQSELQPSVFVCGVWNRRGIAGYGTQGVGAVVSNLSAPLIAHELGHYLSLLHTFTGMDCKNNDCTTDGDKVCDTPPDATNTPGNCTYPENSCNTDTLSGPFTTDVKDNVSNFMDYNVCPSMFTPGQAQRMQDFISIFNGGSLLSSNGCSDPCLDNIQASFNWYGNPYPVTGSTVNFNNTSSGSTDFEWYVNGSLSSTASNYQQSFTSPATYQVLLKAYNTSHTCFASYTGNVIVNCGVDARFSPDKRIVASTSGLYIDTVTFVNKSYNATNYQWFVTDNTGANFTVVSTDKDYKVSFANSGIYKIYLVASNGPCTSSSGIFNIQVLNPKQDATSSIESVNCYKNDSLRISFKIYNIGFDTLHMGRPVRFYDQTPYNNLLQPLKNVFYTPDDILGKCDHLYTVIVASTRPNLDTVAIFVNQENLADELNPNNNQGYNRFFRLKYSVTPAVDTTVYVNDSIHLNISSTGESISTIQWLTNASLSCNNCTTPNFKITDTTYIKTLVKTQYDCYDSTASKIFIYPIDISIANNSIDCYPSDSIIVSSTICLANHYNSFPKPIEIVYYDAPDPNTPNAPILGTYTIPTTTLFKDSCTQIQQVIKKPTSAIISYSINGNNALFEQNKTNNNASVNYTPFQLSTAAHSFEQFRNEQIVIDVNHQGDSITNLKWTPNFGLSCDTCLHTLIKTNASTFYLLKATTKFGCVDTIGISVNVYYQNTLALPNVFTPNGDGLNDHFYVISGKEVSLVKSFQIFNRWGNKVFEKMNSLPNDFKNGWDGTIKGRDAEMGTYVYVIVLDFSDGTSKNFTGTISLIR